MKALFAFFTGFLLALAAPAATTALQPAVVGSKKFTESYVLADIAQRAIERAGYPAEHRQGMGGTIILWEALKEGAITCYPEYTGTIREVILKNWWSHDRRNRGRRGGPNAPAVGSIRCGHDRQARLQQHLRPRNAA